MIRRRNLGYELTEKELAVLEARINKIYGDAQTEINKTIDEYFAHFAQQDAEMQARLVAGEITEEYYRQWRKNNIGRGRRFEAMRDSVALRLTNTRATAQEYINSAMPNVYAINRNYTAYNIEKQIELAGGDVESITMGEDWTLMNESTVRRLLVENPNLMPSYPAERAVARGIDLAYGQQKITECVTSGIIRGVSAMKIANELQSTIPNMSRTSAVRAARTAVTGAQNAGVMDQLNAAEEMGIETEKEWIATNDAVTRDSHRALDGVTVPLKDVFPNGCEYPGDWAAPPGEVYNCFVGETAVTADSEIVRSFKREYEGVLVSVETSAGVNFTCTPNHPILTLRGWVPAESLDVGDDLLVTDGLDCGLSGVNPDVNHAFASFEAVHKFLSELGSERARGLGVNFHGDVATSDVEIVTKERLLGENAYADGADEGGKVVLEHSNSMGKAVSSPGKHSSGVRPSTLGNIGIDGVQPAFLRGHSGHAFDHSLGAISDVDVALLEDAINDGPADLSVSGNSLRRLAGHIFADKVVRIDFKPSHCFVFNLQTENGYYLVNGNLPLKAEENTSMYYAIAHNCRCAMVGVLKEVPKTERSYLRYKNTASSYQEWSESGEDYETWVSRKLS